MGTGETHRSVAHAGVKLVRRIEAEVIRPVVFPQTTQVEETRSMMNHHPPQLLRNEKGYDEQQAALETSAQRKRGARGQARETHRLGPHDHPRQFEHPTYGTVNVRAVEHKGSKPHWSSRTMTSLQVDPRHLDER